MIRVRVLRSTVGDGRVLVVGELLTLPDHEAHVLLNLGKVAVVLNTPPDGAAPEPEHRDPAPSRARGRR